MQGVGTILAATMKICSRQLKYQIIADAKIILSSFSDYISLPPFPH